MSWRLRRLLRPDVAHVELWCAETPRGPLWRHLGADPVAERLDAGEREAAVGRDLAPLLGTAIDRIARAEKVSRVWLGGGLSRLADLAETLAGRLDVPLHASPDGRFSGERGGRRLLESEGVGGGVVVDVGQTSVKASGGGRRIVRERDRGALPLQYIDPERPPVPDASRRNAAVGLIAGAALAALEDAEDDAVVLALPGPIGRDPVPGACTYGWEGDRELLPALLAVLDAARPGGGELLLLNDAELAAESARADLRPGSGERVLCVTLGFGPGAALLAPASA